MTAKPPTLNDLAEVTAEAERINERRDALIVQLALLGEPRADLCKASGLSDDRVRVIERAGGVPERRRGRPRKTA
jgi:hypothetical protein